MHIFRVSAKADDALPPPATFACSDKDLKRFDLYSNTWRTRYESRPSADPVSAFVSCRYFPAKNIFEHDGLIDAAGDD